LQSPDSYVFELDAVYHLITKTRGTKLLGNLNFSLAFVALHFFLGSYFEQAGQLTR
jgi:hypothetical protein